MPCSVAIKNVVCTFDLGRSLSCPLVATSLKARFDANVFPALVSYCRETGTSAQIFGTGKVVIVGCKTNDHGLHAAHLLVSTLWSVMQLNCSVANFHVRNCVCRISVGFRINLDLFYEDAASLDDVVLSDGKCEGGPILDQERFPGMAFAITDQTKCKITIAMFETGNGVGTGIKHPHQMESLRRFLDKNMHKYELGKEYRRQLPEHIRTRKVSSGKRKK